MTTTTELFARCVLPGCGNSTDNQGSPCLDCTRAFTDYLQLGTRPPLTEAEQREATSRSEPHSAPTSPSPLQQRPPTRPARH